MEILGDHTFRVGSSSCLSGLVRGSLARRMVFAGCNFKAPPVEEVCLTPDGRGRGGSGGVLEKPVCEDLALKYTRSGRSVQALENRCLVDSIKSTNEL